MAAVYAATHRNGTRGAIKMLHVELSTNSHVRSRFLKEGYLANKVEHPGVVRVLDDDVAEDGAIFVVMELLDGESLEDRRVRMGGKLDVDEVLAATDQLLDVLVAAHQKGIVHRDIKPENVFLTRDGVIKVLDFGIARLRELSTASSATRVGTTMGTPAFMSPEHARGLWDEVDARSDLWSVGAAMFTLMSGRTVHEGRTTNEVLLSAMSQPAPALATVCELPEHVARVVNRALAFDKGRRWEDARSMQDAVRHAYHAMHGAPISSHQALSVPATVPNKTMASAEAGPRVALASPGTGPAVASGKTGVPLTPGTLPGISRPVLLAAVGVGGALVLFLALVVVGVVVSRHRGTEAPDVVEATAGSTGSPVQAGPAPPPAPSSKGEPLPPPSAPAPSASVLSATTSDAGKPSTTRKPAPDWKDVRK